MQKYARWILFVLFLSSSLVFGAEKNDEVAKIDPNIFGEISARAIGPAVMSGRITSIDVVNQDKKIIFVGTATGGVWRSKSGGVKFEPIFDKHTQSVGAVRVDQKNPKNIWVGTGEHCPRNSVSVGTGVYKSTDGGENFRSVGLTDSERISNILVDPTNSDVVYVAALGHLWGPNEERGVFKTSDGGKTWEKVLYVDENTGASSLAMDPQDPNILYAGMWEFRRKAYTFNSGGAGSNIYKSIDAGKTWEIMRNGLPEGNFGRIEVAVAPSRPNVVYALVEAKQTALYRSDDLGINWREVNKSSTVTMRPFYFSHLRVDPNNHETVYKPGFTFSASFDGGKSFSAGGFGGSVHPDHHAIWINPDNGDHLLIGTDGGVYESRDRGRSWLFFKNLPVSQFYRASYDMKQPYNVYGGLQDNGSWMGPSSSPGGIANKNWENVGGGDGFYVFPDPADDDVIYLESQGGNIVRRHVSTREAKQIKPFPKEGEEKYRFNWNTPIAFSPTNPKRMYAGSQYLLRSTDQGDSWETISPDLTTDDPEKQKQHLSGGITIDNTTAENHCTIYAISESPQDQTVIWAGTDDGNLQVTADDGKTWTDITANIPNLPPVTWCTSVKASAHDRNTAYATFDGHRNNDMTPYVYKTTDLGKTWQALATDAVEGYALDICEDPVNSDLLFLGTEFGLFVSLDGGVQWVRFKGNLPKVGVREIKIHPRDADVILATHGRGIYIIDDITPLRQITQDVLASDVALFESRSFMISIPGFGQEFNGDDQFVGANPNEVAYITYYLKKRHLFGDMRIEIYGPDGELVKTLSGGKRKGINRATWAMRLPAPRIPRSNTLAMGAMFGPMAKAGTYSVKLIKGDKEYTSSLELKHDPKFGHTAEDRDLQHKTVMQLYGMQEKLAYIAMVTTKARDDAKKNAEGLKKGDGLAKDLTRFADELDAFHKTVVSTSRAGMFGGETRLREKIIQIFGSVNGYAGRPSQTELDRIEVLKGELTDAEARFTKIIDGGVDRLNKKLTAKKLKPLEILTEEEFQKQK